MPAEIRGQLERLLEEFRVKESFNKEQAQYLNGLLGGGDVKLVCQGSALAYGDAAKRLENILVALTGLLLVA